MNYNSTWNNFHVNENEYQYKIIKTNDKRKKTKIRRKERGT
jgi:hypothetical protein